MIFTIISLTALFSALQVSGQFPPPPPPPPYNPSAPSCRYETQTEYYDTVYNTLNQYFPTTRSQCCNLCYNTASCMVWVYDTKFASCKLLSTVGYRRFSCGKISGLKNPYVTYPSIITYTTTKAAPTTTAAGTTTTTVATTTKTAGCFVDNNINYPGGDITGSYNVATAEECCNLCGANPSCFSFSYSISDQYCWLKGASNPTNRETYPGFISGVVTVR